MVTPFDDDGKVDKAAYGELVAWYLDQGVHGLFALCLSGEVFELDKTERLELARLTVEACAGRAPVSALASFGDSFEQHQRFGQKLVDAGVDIVVLTPPEFCETEAQLEAYFIAMAEALPRTLGLYECPFPRKRLFSPELIGRLASTGRFGLLKETSCVVEEIAAKVRAVEGTPLAILQADAGVLLDAHRAGADGSVCVVAGAVPRLASALWERLGRGEETELLHDLLLQAESLRGPGQPLGIKFLLQLQGLPVTPIMRRKIPPLSPTEAKRITDGWKVLHQSIAHALDSAPRVPARRDEPASAVPSPKFQAEESRQEKKRRVDTP